MNTFYFVAYTNQAKTSITVIDLDYCVDYERSDWAFVNMVNFGDHLTAIQYARELAKKHNLKYELFDSRYDSSLNEYLTLD